MDKKYVGDKIASLRKEKGFTQKQLAEKLCVTDKAVSKWECGINFPDLAIMESLATELGISVAELLGLEQASSEEVIKEVAVLSAEEKKSIKKKLFQRDIMNIAFGVLLAAAQIIASWEFHKLGMDGGLHGMITTGMMWVVGIMTGNSIYSLSRVRKL